MSNLNHLGKNKICTFCSRVDRTENKGEEKDGSHFWAIFELEKGYSADAVERIQGAKKKYLQSEMAAKAVEKSADTTWQKLLSAEGIIYYYMIQKHTTLYIIYDFCH